MRGKVHAIFAILSPTGITPAYAGKSMRYACAGASGQDHPRLCGEKSQKSDGLRNNRGSPPPMRGKVFKIKISNHSFGITPAYAGKREAEKECSYLRWDHPRLCGEKADLKSVILPFKGSPPPMRGKAHEPANA